MPALRTARRTLAAGSVLAAALLPAATAEAVTWTQVPTGTSAEITSIEYQSATRFWFTTANGAIYTRQGDGSFVQSKGPTGSRLNDVEFQPGNGQIGFAVGAGGAVFRSANAGGSWTQVNGIQGNKPTDNTTQCDADFALADVYNVHFTPDGSAAWLFAKGGQLLRTKDGNLGSTAAGWANADRNPAAVGNKCRITSAYNGSMLDGVVAGNDAVYVTSSYGSIWFSSAAASANGLYAEKTGTAALGDARKMVGDPDSSRLWTVAPNSYGLNSTSYSPDGASTDELRWKIANANGREFPATGPWDVDYNGGTVLSAGDAGLILASTDGANFSYVDAPAFATTAWKAVGLASGTAGAVGGSNGTLLLSSDANALPVPPAVTPVPTAVPTATATPPKTQVPPVQTTKATPTLPSSSNPPVEGKAATVSGKNVLFRVKGRLGVPAGVSRSAACKGTMSISVYKGKKRLTRKTAKVSSKCAYKTTVKVKRRKVGKATKLKLKVAFRGNDVLGKLSSTYNVKVKRR